MQLQSYGTGCKRAEESERLLWSMEGVLPSQPKLQLQLGCFAGSTRKGIQREVLERHRVRISIPGVDKVRRIRPNQTVATSKGGSLSATLELAAAGCRHLSLVASTDLPRPTLQSRQ